MTDQLEPFDLRSHDIPADKREELLRVFPEARTEGRKIDFDQPKRALGETVDPGRERYGWADQIDDSEIFARLLELNLQREPA